MNRRTTIPILLLALTVVPAARASEATPGGATAGHAAPATSTVLFALDADGRAATRLLLSPLPGLVLLAAAESRAGRVDVRVGMAGPAIVAGPLALAGAFAELANPETGSAASPRWLEPASATLDRSLTPAARFGIAVRPLRSLALATWHADDAVTLAAGLALAGGRDPSRGGVTFGSQLIAGATVPLVLDASGAPGVARALAAGPLVDDPLEASWTDDEPRPGLVAHVGVSAHARAERGRGRVASSMAASVSAATALLPGARLRGTLGLGMRGAAEAVALVVVATPGYLEPGGERAAGVRWQASLSATPGAFNLALDAGRRFAPPDLAFAAVGVPWSELRADPLEAGGRISYAPRVRRARLALGSVGVSSDVIVADNGASAGGEGGGDSARRAIEWEAGARLRLLAGEAAELTGTAGVDSTGAVEGRLRAELAFGLRDSASELSVVVAVGDGLELGLRVAATSPE